MSNLQTEDLQFTKGTVYQDMRSLGGNAFRDIKMSLSLGTTSDIVYYLKKYSKLLSGFNGNEKIIPIYQGTFSFVYLAHDHNQKELIIKRSHDGWVPAQLLKNLKVSLPQWVVGMLFQDIGVTQKSLLRDVYDYEKILYPFWGPKRSNITSESFIPYLNMALHLITNFLPLFTTRDLYDKSFWIKLLRQKEHKDLSKLVKYIESIKDQESLIPHEERYIFYDSFSHSLQNIFIQTAIKGKYDIIPGKKMAFPFELVAEGFIPKELSKGVIEHILRTMESFVTQLDSNNPLKKVPDFRPLMPWKVFPPTPCELYFAETNNLVCCKSEKSENIQIKLVDTHVLMEPEGNYIYRWNERRYWMSLFLNLRFWVKKALSIEE
jgi:hypothetical protein